MSQPFDNDIFISYAHIDNLALVEGGKGWVSNFHHALDIRLRQLLGTEAKIWRDAKLQGNDYFSDALVSKFPGVALLVSILSPRYIRSEWCLREVSEFCRAAEQNRGLRLGEKSRIFKVVKTYVPLEDQPSDMQGMLGYEFYQIDPATGRPREFIQDTGANTDIRYWEKLEDLVFEIAELLKLIKRRNESPAEPSSATVSQDCIYLAPTTSDLKTEYDIIRRELQQRGHLVLPDKPLPQNAPEFQEEVRAYLQRSRISVHLVGKHYGVVPEAAERSVVELQNELAAEYCHTHDFPRVIWIPVNLASDDSRQQRFIDRLETDSAAQYGADLLRTDLGELKTHIQDLLSRRSKNGNATSVEDAEPPQVYVIYAEEDYDAAAPVEECLYDAGCEVISPLLEGEDSELLEDHEENLTSCDAAVIFYGNAGDRWFRTKLRDLGEVDARRTSPLLAKAVYLAAPETRQKQRFQTHRALLIRNFADFAPADMQPLITAIEQARGNRN